MGTEQTAVHERRNDSHDRLHTLLDTRKETLSLYNQLAGLRPFKPDRESQLMLQEFCEALVDYTATAHFQLYRFIEEGTERRETVREHAARVYPRIEKTTQFILDFNDKYDCDDHCDNLSGLADDLSALGEVLADRITMEDQLLALLTVKRS